MVSLITELPIPGRPLALAAVERTPSLGELPTSAFLLGAENRLVAAAIQQLIPGRQPEIATSPQVIFLAGSSGTGKTHLARGLCDLWQQTYGPQAAEFVQANDFQHELAQAIRSDRLDEFRSRLRVANLFAIDDLHQFVSDRYVTEELIFTMDTLAERHALLLATSSRPLGALGRLPSAITSRLSAGHLLSLNLPGFAARSELTRRIALALGRPLPDDVTSTIANEITGTANDVFGLVMELLFNPHAPKECNLATVNQYLASRLAGRRPSLAAIVRVVSKYYSVPQKVLKGASRKQSVVFARGVAIFLARTILSVSFQQIGRSFGGRDHTTVMHSYRKIERLSQSDVPTQQAIADMRRLLALPNTAGSV